MATNAPFGAYARLSTDASGNPVLVGADVGDIHLYGSANTIAIIGNSIVAQCLPYLTNTQTKWVPSTAKSLTDAVVPMSFNGIKTNLKYVCTTAGTTASGYNNEPAWPTVAGQSVTDGTVVWEAQADTSGSTDYIRWGAASDWWSWAQAMSGQRLREAYMCGLSGRKWADTALLEQHVIDSGAGVVFLPSVFANDIWSGSAPVYANIQAAWDSYEAFCDRMRNAGLRLIITTELPNGNIDASSPFTGYSSGTGTRSWFWINQKVREYAMRYADRVKLVDFANIYVDTNTANPVWPDNATTFVTSAGGTEKYTDTIHPQTAGAYLIGKRLAALITATFPAVQTFDVGTSIYDIDPNPMNYGTAGTDGTGTTGDVANSLTVDANGTGGACAATKVARTDKAGHWNRLVYTASSGDALAASWYKSAAASTLVAGDVVEAIVEMKITANPTAFNYPILLMRFFGSSDPDYSASGLVASTQAMIGQLITEDTTFTLRCAATYVPTGFTGIGCYFNAIHDNAAAGSTVSIGQHSLRKLSAPDIA